MPSCLCGYFIVFEVPAKSVKSTLRNFKVYEYQYQIPIFKFQKPNKLQISNEENNSRTALAGLTTNEFQIVIYLLVVNAARHVLQLFLFYIRLEFSILNIVWILEFGIYLVIKGSDPLGRLI